MSGSTAAGRPGNIFGIELHFAHHPGNGLDERLPLSRFLCAAYWPVRWNVVGRGRRFSDVAYEGRVDVLVFAGRLVADCKFSHSQDFVVAGWNVRLPVRLGGGFQAVSRCWGLPDDDLGRRFE